MFKRLTDVSTIEQKQQSLSPMLRFLSREKLEAKDLFLLEELRPFFSGHDLNEVITVQSEQASFLHQLMVCSEKPDLPMLYIKDAQTIIPSLIEEGADPWLALPRTHQKETIMVTPFHYAVHGGFSELVELFLKHPNTPNIDELQSMTIQGLPFIHYLVFQTRSGQNCEALSILKTLVNHGMNINQKLNLDSSDKKLEKLKEMTPLFLAQSPNVLKALLDLGANPLIQNAQGQLCTEYWELNQNIMPSTTKEMIRDVQPSITRHLTKVPAEQRWPIIRQRSLEIMEQGQKRALVELFKGAELRLEDLFFPGVRPRSGLFEASMKLLNDPNMAFHTVNLLSQYSKQSQHETLPGIPDLFWACWTLENLLNHGQKKRVGTQELYDKFKSELALERPEFRFSREHKKAATMAMALHAPAYVETIHGHRYLTLQEGSESFPDLEPISIELAQLYGTVHQDPMSALPHLSPKMLDDVFNDLFQWVTGVKKNWNDEKETKQKRQIKEKTATQLFNNSFFWEMLTQSPFVFPSDFRHIVWALALMETFKIWSDERRDFEPKHHHVSWSKVKDFLNVFDGKSLPYFHRYRNHESVKTYVMTILEQKALQSLQRQTQTLDPVSTGGTPPKAPKRRL